MWLGFLFFGRSETLFFCLLFPRDYTHKGSCPKPRFTLGSRLPFFLEKGSALASASWLLCVGETDPPPREREIFHEDCLSVLGAFSSSLTPSPPSFLPSVAAAAAKGKQVFYFFFPTRKSFSLSLSSFRAAIGELRMKKLSFFAFGVLLL